MRWRDSGDVEPPRRAARNAATGTPITQRASARASLRTVTSPISASTSTTTRTGQRPVLKSPAVCHRYVTIAHGPPSLAPWPPTPTSNRPASTRSVSQNGTPDDRHGGERDHRLPQALPVGGEHEHALGREHERAVRDAMRPRAGWRLPRAPSSSTSRDRARGAGGRTTAARGTGTGCTSGRRRRGRGTPSCRRRARWRSAPRERPARRRPRSAIRGRLATANTAETSRRLPSPRPRCATA